MSRTSLHACLILATLAVFMDLPSAQRADVRPLGLDDFFSGERGLVLDSNGDGLADMVAARVIVPAKATPEDTAAATNISARVGFETNSMSLPIAMTDRDPGVNDSILVPILIGRTNAVVTQLAARGDVDLKALSQGQGLIAVVRSPLGGADGVVIVGGDDAGTLAAANVLAGRLPRLWNMSGITLSGVADQVAGTLSASGIQARNVVVRAIVVDSDRRGIATVHLSVTVASGQAQRATRVLEAVDHAHRRGLLPQTLNFAEIARTSVELWADGRLGGQATVMRAGLNSRTLTPPIDPDELAPDSPGDRGRPADGGATASQEKMFDLSNPYSIDGWFGDAYIDLIPDRTETSVVIGTSGDAVAASHIAARLGLETTGLTFPLARLDRQVRDFSRETNPIIVGRENRLLQELVKVGRTSLAGLVAGEGVVHVVPHAFGSTTATVVAGADAAGTEAAALYLARRVPYVWDNRRGGLSFEDVSTEVGRFLGARSAAGQAALALRELDDLVFELADKTLESFDATLYLEAANPALDDFLSSMLSAALKGASVSVKSLAITDAVPVIEETIEVPWEVDEFRDVFKNTVLPAVKAGSNVELEARLSESPSVRNELVDEIIAQLRKAGATNPDVRVLSAYKQGFLWMTEQLIPALKGKGARAMHIRVAEYKPDFSKKYKFYQVPSRWMHELYPVDELVERELGIPRDRFTMELVDSPADIYTVEALDGAGRVVHRATFSPKFAEREYLDKFPGWSRVDVTTGWVTARVDGAKVVDARIKTDPERFWDHYQAQTLPQIYDHVMKVTDNRPLPEKQPFHRDLNVEVWMSEPDFRIGVDEELVSSLESLHEDLYFVTLDFFDALGRTTTKRRLAAPGKIFPIIHPEQAGRPGRATVLYAGNASTKAKLDVSYREEGVDTPTRVSRDLAPVDVTPPAAMRARVRADRVGEIELHVQAKDDVEASRAGDAFDALVKLHAAGLFKEALSYQQVDAVAVAIAVKDVRARRVVTNSGAAATSNVHTATSTPVHPVVTWDHVIGPDESEEIVAKLAAYPEVRAYRAGRSYRGRPISAMEIAVPPAGELVSLAKLTTSKPTILITGRQHANEVSSTSHILRLGELLVTDPAYREILKKVNVVLHPIENPDGADMAYELQKLTPTHMLHAGRYSALGMDVASQVGLSDPLLPEALVRTRLWRDWLPDIYLNPHGYPSHEWVQQFAGYVPPGFRTYWSTRGWWTSINGLRDPRYPEHGEAVSALRDAVAREVNTNADVREMNRRHQARYRKWAYGFSPYVYGQEIYRDTAIYYGDAETGEPRGSRRAGVARGGRNSMSAWPQVTFMSGMTESPDETATGEWLTLVTKPGFSFLMAHINYLREGGYRVERVEEDGQRDTTSLTLLRVRPVRPSRSQ